MEVLLCERVNDLRQSLFHLLDSLITTAGNRRTRIDHLNWSIIKIGYNTEKSPGDLRRFAVAQTPVKEEARRQLHKNVASNIEQVLAATPHKAPTIRPPASHHENYTS